MLCAPIFSSSVLVADSLFKMANVSAPICWPLAKVSNWPSSNGFSWAFADATKKHNSETKSSVFMPRIVEWEMLKGKIARRKSCFAARFDRQFTSLSRANCLPATARASLRAAFRVGNAGVSGQKNAASRERFPASRRVWRGGGQAEPGAPICVRIWQGDLC